MRAKYEKQQKKYLDQKIIIDDLKESVNLKISVTDDL